MLARDGRHRLLQHTVDAVLYMHRIIVGFDVYVGGSPFQCGEDGRVHQPDNGADVFFARQLFNGNIFVGVFVARQHIEGQPLAGFVQHALRLLGLLQQFGNLRERRHARNDAMREQPGNLVEHHQLRRVADRNHQRVLLLFDGHKVVAEHQLHRDRAQQLVLNLEILQVHKLCVVALGHGFSLSALLRAARKRPAGKWNRKLRCVSHDLSRTSGALPQREDGQVKRDENEDHHNAHHDQDGRLNQRQCRGESGGHILLKKL